MQINEAMFENNGRCGYILKPAHLRLPNVTRALTPVMLTVQVISAQQLPKPRESEKGVIIDPFVEVEIIGVEKDQSLFRTKHIPNNGFNPRWDETVVFKILDPEFAFLRCVAFCYYFFSRGRINFAYLNFSFLQNSGLRLGKNCRKRSHWLVHNLVAKSSRRLSPRPTLQLERRAHSL
jgi:hypothetical protein